MIAWLSKEVFLVSALSGFDLEGTVLEAREVRNEDSMWLRRRLDKEKRDGPNLRLVAHHEKEPLE